MALSKNGLALIALSSIFFAAMATLARTLAGAVPAAEQVVLRHAVGLVAMGALFLARRRGPTRSRPGLLLLRGVLGGGAVLTYFIAIEQLGPAPATVLSYVSPVYAAIWAWLFLGERPGPTIWGGLAVATAGAGLVAWANAGPSTTHASTLGAAAGLASGLLGGAAMATVKAVREDADAATVFTSFSLVGLVIAFPVAWPGWVPLSGGVAWTALGVGMLALCGQLLFTLGMGFTTATAGSATTQLVPVLSFFLSTSLLGEPVRPLGLAGSALCVVGVLVGVWPRPRSEMRRSAEGV